MQRTTVDAVLSRREAIIQTALAGAAGAALLGLPGCASTQPGAGGAKSDPPPPGPLFQISLAQWSLHNALYAGKLDHLDFPKTAKNDYAIDAVEYVNTFFKEKGNPAYVNELKKRCADLGVRSVLIMCDGEGAIGDPDTKKRRQAVENHYKWVEAAQTLGCHSIRVNAQSEGTFEEQMDRAADGLRQLCEFGDAHGINVIVENHGGLSSHGDWLVGVMKKVGSPRVGTLPDFGNFKEYDRYKGVAEMMPYARGVSAKSYGFDEKGDETTIDYWRMMKIVLDAGYHGRLGIEFEGEKPEPEGIRSTKRLLERIRDQMSAKTAHA